MSITPLQINPAGLNITPPVISKPKISISQTLQSFLNETIDGNLHWQRHSKKKAGRYQDEFQASQNGIQLKLTGEHPTADGQGIPNRLINWQAELTTSGKSPRILDGTSMVLPETVNDSTPLTVQTLPKLFRKVYDSVSSSFSAFAPLVKQLTQKLSLHDPHVESSYSFIRPSLLYPTFGSGSVMQITDKTQNLKVEITQFAGESNVTIRHGGKTTKLRKPELENPELFGAVDSLVKEANFQRTNKPDMGLRA